MSDLVKQVAAAISSRRLVSLRTGTIATDGETVTQSGGTVTVTGWLDGVRVAAGDPVLLAMVEAPDAQAAAVVLGTLTDAADLRPWSGTVTAQDTGARTCTVTIGSTSTTGVLYVGDAPGVGAVVLLEYKDDVILAVGAITQPPAPPAPTLTDPTPTPPPPPPTNVSATGTTTLAAVSSGTYDLGRGSWNSYYGDGVYQGSNYGNVNAGAWFHGTAPAQLAGKTLERVTLNLGGMQRAGSYNSSRTLNVYRTTATSKSGEPPRTEGPVTFTVPAITDGFWANPVVSSAGLLTLVTNMVAAGGGGLVVTGGDYLGLTGISTPASGLLTCDWTA